MVEQYYHGMFTDSWLKPIVNDVKKIYLDLEKNKKNVALDDVDLEGSDDGFEETKDGDKKLINSTKVKFTQQSKLICEFILYYQNI